MSRSSASGEPMISVVVLNLNKKLYTLECLRSLRKPEYTNYNVIVVDQDSSDASCEAIASEFPEVTLIHNEGNLGFAEGCNVGIRHAMNGDAEYIVLLNNDTTVEPSFLRALVDAATHYPDFDVFGPKIVYDSDPNVIWAAGSHIDWQQGSCTQRGYRELDRGQYDANAEVNALSGCAMMISCKALETVGLLDSRFFAYYEETDWCARATKAGYRILYVPAAVVRHKVSGTIGASSPAITFYMVRNNLLFIAKNSKRLPRLPLMGKALCKEARTVCSGLIKGRREDALTRLRAIAAFFFCRFGKAGL